MHFHEDMSLMIETSSIPANHIHQMHRNQFLLLKGEIQYRKVIYSHGKQISLYFLWMTVSELMSEIYNYEI